VQPALRTPPPVTPPPITLGPLRAAQHAAERRHQRRALLLFGSLGVLAAVALLAVLVPLFFPARSAPHAEVRTVTAAPGTVLRYFLGSGAITAMPGVVLKFPAPGLVTRIAKADSAVAIGDVVAAVEAAKPLLNQLTHLRERLAFYQQIAETMHQVGNTAEEEKSTANVEVRKAKIAKTLRALSQVAVVASSAGQVEEAFAREGDQVEAGGLALRMRSTGHRAIFELPRAQAAEARRLGFCQVGVDGYVLDCRQAPDEDDETHVSVDIATLPAALLGRPARLARARFDDAVALPASAVQSAGRRHQVLVVSAFGRLEARPVTLAEQNAAEAVVIQGLDSGENVVLEPSSDLRPGTQVTARP
jgi:multidrug efflux pump subunit AcrA (membrane-fusion protein)